MNKGKQVHERSLAPEESDLITLDATLLLAMETAKDRAFILDIESLIVNFIQNTQYINDYCLCLNVLTPEL